MRKTLRKSETLSELAPMLLVLISLLTIAAVSFGRTPPIQTDSRPVSLFKVAYGEKPTQLRVRFPGSRLISEENGDELREPLPGGGPTTFCVSWDGQLFYIADPLRHYDKNLELPPQAETSTEDDQLAPWVQVYNRQGQWVRTIKLKHGFPSRIRVDEQGWLYVDDAKRGVAIYRPDGTYDKQRTEAVGEAIKRAATEFRLDSEVATPEFFEVDRNGRVYFLARQIVSEEGGTKQLEGRLLVIHPDGRSNLLDYPSYDQAGIDRYRGEIIIGDYDVRAEGRMEVQFVVIHSRSDEEPETDTITLFRKETYKRVRPDGEVVSRFDWYLDISDRVPNVWDGFVGTVNLERHLAIATDEARHLYRVYSATRRHWITVDDPADPDRGIALMDGFWIIEFTPDGRFVRPRASNLRLIGSYGHQENLVGRLINLWDVDKHGNVYWIEFHPDHLEVKMSPR
ncbi:MAG: hypothetical protein KatS3mg016_1115 [Fimbriimonadales bacterium]|nr:MAG: hypothetical protein KatS3mg016_1115 [Fimbriimonadales bacterium]